MVSAIDERRKRWDARLLRVKELADLQAHRIGVALLSFRDPQQALEEARRKLSETSGNSVK